MKRAVLFLAIGGILAVVSLCVAAASPAAAGDPDIEQLQKEIETLRQRVESLEKRLAEQSLAVPKTHPWRLIPPDPNSLLAPRSAPRNWKQFEFNGQSVYVIPIQNGSPSAPGPEPAK